ncbi:SCO family protein [Planococcus halotolerans]|uniref:SCO family protein n=1 Tax=Planococcus halotolerans TaxID=2233542 RepID=A0A365KVG6_9BACL|nr:SCO family protein [Planococcus halotolerans]RAZ76735.1 SCO family protein [Planococcus halotolerans]
MKKLMGIAVIALVLFLAACGDSSIEDFSHTDQRGEEITLESLKGTPWLATFVFTNCTTVCPPMTFNMVSIQEALLEQGIEEYKIVAFSVDPGTDKPAVLADYLGKFNVPDESKWHLLTGYSQDYIAEYAKDNFKSFVKNDPSSNQVVHGTSFYLIDKNGEVAHNYDGYSDVPVEEIVEDLKVLIDK